MHQIDDVLVFSKDQEEHDQRLRNVLEQVKKAKVTLNPVKCEFSKSTVKFLGYIINQSGIRAVSKKTGSIS